METLKELFILEIKGVKSSAESMTQLLKRMSSLATHRKLAELLDTYYFQSQYQRDKLNDYLKEQPKTGSLIMRKVNDHALTSMRYKGSTKIRDLALILSLNIMKHIEQTAIGAAITHAKQLKLDEEADMLLSLQNIIAERQGSPLLIANQILKDHSSPELKDETSVLFLSLLQAHLRDEEKLLDFLPSLNRQARSKELKTAISDYQASLQKNHDRLSDIQTTDSPDDWGVMDSFINEAKKHLDKAQSDIVNEQAIIFSIQRMQHQTMALLEIEELLARFLDRSEIQSDIRKFLSHEQSHNNEFTKMAQGALFQNR